MKHIESICSTTGFIPFNRESAACSHVSTPASSLLGIRIRGTLGDRDPLNKVHVFESQK